MYFLLNRNDRSGSIILLMLYMYSYCYKYHIKYDGLISDNGWWYNNPHFSNKIKKMFGISNKKINKNLLKEIKFSEIKTYSHTESNDVYMIFDVNILCPYFSKNINLYFDDEFKNYMNNKIISNTCDNKNNNRKIISIHIRRGDVNQTIPRRYTNDIVYINLINNIIENENLQDYEIHIFSEKNFNGNINTFNTLKNVQFHLENDHGSERSDLTNVFNDILFMIKSDYLICSKSGFSYVPALLNKTGKIYHNNNFWCTPLKKFILYNDNTGIIQ